MNKKCILCGGKTTLLYKDLFDDRYSAPGLYDIYKCPKCGFGRTNPELKNKEIGKFYKKYYPLSRFTSKQVEDGAKIPSNPLSWLSGTDNTSHWHIQRGNDVLDIGSGSGVSLLEIQMLGANAFGVEPDPNAQILAKKLQLKVYKGFITDNPFPGKKFDFITASQVIEHEPDPEKFLNAAKNKLKNTGQIILSFPNVNALYRKVFRKAWIHWHVPYHINHFSQDAISILAKKTGLKIIKMRTVTPNLWTVLQIRSLFTRPIHDKPSLVWGASQIGKAGKLSNNNFLSTILTYLIHLSPIVIAPANRLLDLFGQGESLLVFLEKI